MIRLRRVRQEKFGPLVRRRADDRFERSVGIDMATRDR
jgi:hypothetical protein